MLWVLPQFISGLYRFRKISVTVQLVCAWLCVCVCLFVGVYTVCVPVCMGHCVQLLLARAPVCGGNEDQ